MRPELQSREAELGHHGVGEGPGPPRLVNFEWHQASESGALRARAWGGRAGGGPLRWVWLIRYKNVDATGNFCISEKTGNSPRLVPDAAGRGAGEDAVPCGQRRPGPGWGAGSRRERQTRLQHGGGGGAHWVRADPEGGVSGGPAELSPRPTSGTEAGPRAHLASLPCVGSNGAQGQSTVRRVW